MATPLMGYATPVTGASAGTWGDDINNTFTTYVDNNFAGITSKSLSSFNVTLTAAEARNQMLRLTGTLLANITIDAGASLWLGVRCIENLTSGSFTVTLSNSGTVAIPQGRRCLVFIDSSNGPRIVAIAGSSTADPIPAASKVLFYNASAPSGWTAVALNDYAVKIVSNGSGAATSGSVAYSTLYARTATDGYALLTADIPSHTHGPGGSGTSFLQNQSGGAAGLAGGTTVGSSTLTGATGGGGSHSHGIDMRVQTAAFVLASRD